MLEDCIRQNCKPPAFHTTIYVKDGDIYSHADWKDYRNPAFRHRPQPCLTFSVAAGFWQHLLLVVVISILVVCYHHYLEPLGAPSINTGMYGSGLLTMATFFLSLLLVFKLNNSYARWWEARTQWGTALAMLRCYLSVLNSHTSTDVARGVAAKARRWAPACMLLFKAHLRDGGHTGGNPIEAIKDLLTEKELEFLATCSNKPLAGGHVLNQLAVELGAHPIIVSQLHTTVSQWLLQVAGAERILRTPLPQSYHRFTSRACMLYICMIPILILPISDWLTPLVVLIIAFMLGVEHISAQIEEPFHVLHLDSLCNATLSASNEPWCHNSGSHGGAGLPHDQGQDKVKVDLLQAVLLEQDMKRA